MNGNPIGVLDSGVGGLSILKEIVRKLPNESTVYIADSKNCPYGVKTEKEIYRLSKRMVKFLIQKKVKLIVIACNTITVSCLDKLRKDFSDIPIIGTVPVVKTAAKLTKSGRIGVLSTKHTAESKYQKDLIKKFCKGLKVLNLGTDRLVPLIEQGAGLAVINSSEFTRLARDARQSLFKSLKIPRSLSEKGLRSKFSKKSGSFFSSLADGQNSLHQILKEELKPFLDFKIDVLVLGCSHFPLIKKEIGQALGKNVQVLDSGGAVARQTKRVLVSENLLSRYNKPEHIFYTTGDLNKLIKLSKKLLKEKSAKITKFKKINL